MPDKHPSTLSEISVKDLPALVKGEEDLVYIPQSQDRESGKYEIRDTTGKLDFDGALDEVVADGCEMMLKRSSVVSTLARENPSLFDRIHDWLKEWAAKIRKAFSGVEAYHEEAKAKLSYMDQLQKIWDKALTEAARNAQTENESAQIDNESAQNENKLPTEDRKMTASDGGRVQYSSRDEVLATEDVDWFVIKREGAAKRNRGRVDNGPGTTPPRRATSSVVRIPQTTDKSNPQKSERDAEYMQAVNNGNTTKAQRMVDEAARQAGYTKLFYHGSKKGGGFTVFHDWQYFTENKDYAMRYTQRDNPGSLYTVYAKMEHPFDTRDAEAAEIFALARQELGLGEIQESGLPDRRQSVMIDIKNTRPHFGTACFVLFIPVICRRRSIPELWSI